MTAWCYRRQRGQRGPARACRRYGASHCVRLPHDMSRKSDELLVRSGGVLSMLCRLCRPWRAYLFCRSTSAGSHESLQPRAKMYRLVQNSKSHRRSCSPRDKCAEPQVQRTAMRRTGQDATAAARQQRAHVYTSGAVQLVHLVMPSLVSPKAREASSFINVWRSP